MKGRCNSIRSTPTDRPRDGNPFRYLHVEGADPPFRTPYSALGSISISQFVLYMAILDMVAAALRHTCRQGLE